MPVACYDLGRDGVGFQPESLAGDPLHLRVRGGIRADRAGELSDAHLLERGTEPPARPVELERPSGELQPERGGLGVDAMGTADRQCVPVLVGASEHGFECTLDPAEE